MDVCSQNNQRRSSSWINSHCAYIEKGPPDDSLGLKGNNSAFRKRPFIVLSQQYMDGDMGITDSPLTPKFLMMRRKHVQEYWLI